MSGFQSPRSTAAPAIFEDGIIRPATEEEMSRPELFRTPSNRPGLVRTNTAIHKRPDFSGLYSAVSSCTWDILNEDVKPLSGITEVPRIPDFDGITGVSADSVCKIKEVIDLTGEDDMEEESLAEYSDVSQDELCLCVFDDDPDLCISCNHPWRNNKRKFGLSFDPDRLKRPFRVIIDITDEDICYDYVVMDE